MTQHDLEWANQFFPQMRTDMNNALIAMSTRQAGDGAPALVAAARPNRMYVDVTRKQVLARDNADTTDYIWDSWAQPRVRHMATGGDNFLPEDVNRLVLMQGAAGIGLPQATGLFGDGWNAEFHQLGGGTSVIYPNVSTINGLTSFPVDQYQGLKIFSQGGQYYAAPLGRGSVPTGAISMWVAWGTPPTGYVRLMGGWIGNAASGANERAHADTWPLYSMLYGYYSDAYAPVWSGRSGNAATDFNANKALRLFDMRGRTIFGVDHGAGVLTAPVVGGLNGNLPGSVGGEQMHYMQGHEVTQHQHGLHDPGHAHAVRDNGGQLMSTVSPSNWDPVYRAGAPWGAGTAGQHITQTEGNGTGMWMDAYGGSYPFNVVPPGIALGCWIIKL